MRLTVRDVPNAGCAMDGIASGLLTEGMTTDVRLKARQRLQKYKEKPLTRFFLQVHSLVFMQPLPSLQIDDPFGDIRRMVGYAFQIARYKDKLRRVINDRRICQHVG